MFMRAPLMEQAGSGPVFERDDDTAYLYLLDTRKEEVGRIVAAFSVDAINDMPTDVPISIR